jgi:F0F1-type ATP synthase assembly protein I
MERVAAGVLRSQVVVVIVTAAVCGSWGWPAALSALGGGAAVVIANAVLWLLTVRLPPEVMLIGELLRLLAGGGLMAVVLTASGVSAGAALAGFVAAALTQLIGAMAQGDATALAPRRNGRDGQD